MEKYSDFICIHGDEKSRADELELWIRKQNFDKDYPITHIVANLEWDYGVSITRIGYDQWGGVSAEKRSYANWSETGTHEVVFKAFVQCDIIEHGFYAIYRYCVENMKKSENN